MRLSLVPKGSLFIAVAVGEQLHIWDFHHPNIMVNLAIERLEAENLHILAGASSEEHWSFELGAFLQRVNNIWLNEEIERTGATLCGCMYVAVCMYAKRM